MSVVRFTETVFKETGKKGILVPDADGYYDMVVGGLNVENSAGDYYTANQAIKLFEKSSQLMRRIRSGALYSELGHPQPQPGMSKEDFYRRVIRIDEQNICAHFSDLFLDTEFGQKHPELNNPRLIAVIAKVTPSGVKAEAVRNAFNNPKQNAAFSVRGITDNVYRGGRYERTLTTIVTYDFVPEPGIKIADKYMSPSLEQFHEAAAVGGFNAALELMDEVVDLTLLRKVISTEMTNYACESSKALFSDILKNINKRSAGSHLSKW